MAGATVSVKGNLHGLKAVRERLEACRSRVFVGVPASAGSELATIAAANEFGAPDKNIPERSFLRGGLRRAAKKIAALNAANMSQVLHGQKSVAIALDQLGAVASGEVKREFVVGDFAPNAPATIRRKGSSRPLIDTGRLRQSITWEVRPEGEGDNG